MKKERQSFLGDQQELQSSFRFDSSALYKASKKNEKKTPRLQDIDFSQRTSQIIRFAECKNQNILQLLQQSDQQIKTQRANTRNQLWQFFAKFQQESNPDITISDIEIPQNKKAKIKQQHPPYNYDLPTINNEIQPQYKPEQIIRKKQNKNLSNRNKLQISQNSLITQSNMEPRYPKRTRVPALRYWLGQKCEYRHGKMVEIKRLNPSNTQKMI